MPMSQPRTFSGSKSEVVPENFVLTARRTETGRDTRVQSRVRFVDLVAAGKAIGPDVAELIEMIETSASDEDQVFDRR